MIWVVGDPSTGTSAVMGALRAGGAPLAPVVPARDGPFHAMENNHALCDPMRLRYIRDETLVLKVFPGNAIRCLRKAIIPTHAVVLRRPLEEARASRARRFPDRPAMLAINGERLEHGRRLLYQAHVAVLEVQFHALLADPRVTCDAVAEFLPFDLDVAAMAAFINPDRPWRDSYPVPRKDFDMTVIPNSHRSDDAAVLCVTCAALTEGVEVKDCHLCGSPYLEPISGTVLEHIKALRKLAEFVPKPEIWT